MKRTTSRVALQIQRPAAHRARQDAEDARQVFLALAARAAGETQPAGISG